MLFAELHAAVFSLRMRCRHCLRNPIAQVPLVFFLLILQAGCQSRNDSVQGVTGSTHKNSYKNAAGPVGAYGSLQPRGGILNLGIPYTGQNNGSIVAQIFVKEGDKVSKGQVLARLDSYYLLKKSVRRYQSLAGISRQRKKIQADITRRYKLLNQEGAASDLRLEEAQLLYLFNDLSTTNYEEQLDAALQRLQGAQVVSPIEGIVLDIFSREGEAINPTGILQVANVDDMVAELEVYENDIGKITIGQPVELKSENNAFGQTLRGSVEVIIPQVRQQQTFRIQPIPNIDERVVLVKIHLDRSSERIASKFQGAHVLARFE